MKVIFTTDHRPFAYEVAAAKSRKAKPNESYTVARKDGKYVVVHRVIELA